MPHRRNTIEPQDDESANIINDQVRRSSTLSEGNNHSDIPLIQRDAIDETNFPNYAINTLGLEDARIEEFDVVHPPVRTKFALEKIEMPRWLILLLSNAFIIILILTFCVVFIYQQSTVGLGESCLQNSNCNAYLGLKCTAGTCSCSTVEFWNGVQCIPQRTFNRSCTLQSQCNSIANLLCLNVTIGLYTDSYCWCSSYRYWTGNQCAFLKSFNETCSSNAECDIYDFLTCINGSCNCNSTQFWNYEYCENKRSYGEQCFSTSWCNRATSGLVCSTWEPTAGTCDCPNNQYWWSANETCLSQLPINSTCSSTYQCITNQSLICSSTTNPPSCQCSNGSWYNSTTCTSQFLSGSTCTNSLQCDSTLLLTCNLTAGICTCNESSYIWDGTQCVIRRTIGGACSSDGQCLASQNLICPTSGVWNSTCACPTNYYWNTTNSLCVLQKLWNETCESSYECYGGGNLSCELSSALNTTICDCANNTYYWTGFLNNTYSGYCTQTLSYGVACISSYECQEYNLLSCISSQCQCSTGYTWNSVSQQCDPVG